MKKVTLITAILILATSFVSFAGNTTNNNNLKHTETTTVVSSEKDAVIEFTSTQLNNDKIEIENNLESLENDQFNKTTLKKLKINNIENFLRNPEQQEAAAKKMC